MSPRRARLAFCLIAVLVPLQRAWSQDGGGFHIGDRILLRVEGESLYTDTFTVIPGPALRLPVIGDVSLMGVPRASIEQFLTGRLGSYFKHPVIHATSLVSLGVLGEVEHPGYYVLPGDALLTDVLMAAGGPTRDAKFADLRIERDRSPVWRGERLQQAMAARRTIADLSLQQGDRVVMPRAERHDPESFWRIIGIVVTLPVAIYGLTKLK